MKNIIISTSIITTQSYVQGKPNLEFKNFSGFLYLFVAEINEIHKK